MMIVGVFLHIQLLVNLFIIGKQLWDHDTEYIPGTMVITVVNVLAVYLWAGVFFP